MKHEDSTRRTKELLAASLKRKMEKKKLSKITISEIIEDCDLNRRTFYYHFEDIYALVEWMFEQEAIRLLRKSESCLTWEEGVLLFLRYIRDNEHICRCALDGLGREQLQRFFYKDCVGIMGAIVNELNESIGAPKDYLEFITRFYTSALAETAIWWLSSGMEKSPEKLVHELELTMQGNIEPALEKAAQ